MSDCLQRNVELKQSVDNVWTHAIASKTRALYNTGYSHFERFLTLDGVNFAYLIKSLNSCRRVSIIFILIA